MSEAAVLFVGESRGDDELHQVWAEPFERHAWRVERVADLTAAKARLAQPRLPAPQLVVLGEPRPGLWAESELADLRRLAPLARFVRYSGAWCEGQARSGHPPAGTTGHYWHRWSPQISRQLAAIAAGANPAWAQPVTVTPDEQLLGETPRPMARSSGTILLHAASTSTREALRAACEQGGYRVLSAGESAAAAPAMAVLWDTPAGSLHDAATIASVRQSAGGAPVLALVGFPRPDDVQAASAAGVCQVISKPWNVADLLWHLAQLGPPPAV